MARLNHRNSFLCCLAATVIGFLPAMSQARDCVDYDKAMVQWKRYNWITERDENGRRKAELCAPAVSHKVFKALIALDELGLLTFKRDALDRGIVGYRPAKYFSERVREIELATDRDKVCIDRTLAHVVPNNSRVHICSSFAELSTLVAMETLVHEARHTKDDLFHVKCLRRGFYGHRQGCDPSYEAGGAYAVSAEFYLRVARTEGLPAALRQEARAKFLLTLFHRFNKLPSIIEPSFLLQDTKGGVYLSDTNGNLKKLFTLNGTQWMVGNTHHYPVAINRYDGRILRYLLRGEFIDDKLYVRWVKFFKKPYVDAGSSRIKDIAMVQGFFHCFLIDSEPEPTIECPKDEKPFRAKVGWAKPLYLGQFNNMLTFTSTDGRVYFNPLVIMADESVRILGPQSWNGFRELSTSHRYLSLFELDIGTYIGLNMNGQVVKIERSPLANPVLIEPLRKYKFVKAAGPITWSAELDEI